MKRIVLVLALAACSEKKPTPPNLANGAAEYQTRCALCHGPTGAGDGPMSASLAVKPRTLADPMGKRRSPMRHSKR